MKNKKQHRIVYLSHGIEKYHTLTRFSILTLLNLLIKANRTDIQIIVYTDRPDKVPAHEFISSIYINPDELKSFQGSLEYIHRIKLKVLVRAQKQFNEPFIYVDCDTRWIKIPDVQLQKISEPDSKIAYMHKLEGTISTSFFPQYFRLMGIRKVALSGFGIDAESAHPMWNAGTVAIPANKASFYSLALEINDALLPYVRYKNCVEQLALTLLAERDFEIQAFDDCLVHYWNYGDELPVVLNEFFSSLPGGLSTAQTAKLCSDFQIQEEQLRQIMNLPANRFYQWRMKMKNSLRKYRIGLKAFLIRRNAISTHQ